MSIACLRRFFPAAKQLFLLVRFPLEVPVASAGVIYLADESATQRPILGYHATESNNAPFSIFRRPPLRNDRPRGSRCKFLLILIFVSHCSVLPEKCCFHCTHGPWHASECVRPADLERSCCAFICVPSPSHWQLLSPPPITSTRMGTFSRAPLSIIAYLP